MVYRPKKNFDFCACLSKKVVKPASTEMQRCVRRFEGRFDRFEAISVDSRPQSVKNVLKMGYCGKTPGVNGLKWLFMKWEIISQCYHFILKVLLTIFFPFSFFFFLNTLGEVSLTEFCMSSMFECCRLPGVGFCYFSVLNKTDTSRAWTCRHVLREMWSQLSHWPATVRFSYYIYFL